MSSCRNWAEALTTWAVPPEILEQAPESPYGFPVETFANATTAALQSPLTPTHRHALDALPEQGSVLDVGAGVGAASLPLAPHLSCLIAVDSSAAMLESLWSFAPDGLEVETVQGKWPDIAPVVRRADVVVCSHVTYNVPNLDEFVAALHEHATHRVVIEMTLVHPQTRLSPLWQHFWNVERPTSPTVDDAMDVITETLGAEVHVESERWTRPDPGAFAGRTDEEVVAMARRRLCLPESADAEIAALLGPSPRLAPSEVATIWWPA